MGSNQTEGITKATRKRLSTQNGYGYRPVNNWGSGDLPCPYAEGDLVRVNSGSAALERMHGMGPGLYVICCAFSIDEGDAWYMRVSKGPGRSSDRLHVAFPERSEAGDFNFMDGVDLIDTADPDGLAKRRLMLAEGWEEPWKRRCPTCRSELPRTFEEDLVEALARPVPGPGDVDRWCRCVCHDPHPGTVVMWNHALGPCCPGAGVERSATV